MKEKDRLWLLQLPLNVRSHNFTSCVLDTTIGAKMIVAGIAADLIGCKRQRLRRKGNTFMEVLRDLVWDILTLGTNHRTARLKAVCMFEYSSDTKCLSANLFTCASWKRAHEPLGWASSVLYSSFIQESITVRRMSWSSLMKMCFRKKREKRHEGTIGYCIIIILSAAIGIGLIWAAVE